MSTAAKGSALALGLAPERAFGVPASGLVEVSPILPAAFGLVGTESPSAQVNRSGFNVRGVPGPKSGEVSVLEPLTAANLIWYFGHLLGRVVKTNPEAGVFVYTFFPVLVAEHFKSFWGVGAREPVERELLHGIRFGSLAMAIQDNVEIPVTLSGLQAHGTRCGVAVAEAGNTGAYTLGPWVRGGLADPSLGDVWVQITRLPAGGGLRYKVEQSVGLPAFQGSDVDAAYDVSGEGAWRHLQDHDGRDLGFFDENKDPLEIVFPGTTVDHDTAAIGDVWRFQVPDQWAVPLTVLPRASKLTSAHWVTRARAIGDPAYAEFDATGGSITLEYAAEFDRGNGSRYAHDILRPGNHNPTSQVTRSLVNRYFADFFDRHERLDLQHAFEGRQIGASNSHREGIVITMPSARIDESARPVAAPTTITETVNFVGETDDAGNDPVSVVITTERDVAIV